MFRNSLLDLVKGLRTHKNDESTFINQCLSEIKEEVKNKDHDIKAQAILKLTYLYMLGYDMSFSHFNVVEVMSQPCFSHRRIAYLASSLSFTEDTDVILLTTHLFKKAFSQSQGANPILAEGIPYETGCAINCLSNICTPYLGETLLEDVYAMMNSTRPYVKKKAVLVLYSMFRKYPKALRLSFDRLKEKLKDEDPGVQNAAVNVICELARKNPSNYLGLLPQLFELLNNSNNNWMLIKLVKLLGALIPAEPRLAKKLQEPLTHIITNTPAKSLLYECINTVTSSDQMAKGMIRLCLEKLRTFVEDPDQNLKYLGLLGLNKVMKQNPKGVAQHRDLIIQCLDDPDVTIRMRSLDLITNMVTPKNLEAIVVKLTDHLYSTDGNYREHVLEQIINVCAKEDYANIEDFGWYIELLTKLTQLSSMSKRNADLLSSQLMDVTIRVEEVRDFAVEQMEGLIVNNGLISDVHNMANNSICRVLKGAAYIVGEFSKFVSAPLTLVKAMLQSRIASLPNDIQCIFIHNALKVVCAGLNKTAKSENKNQNSKDLVEGTIQLLEPLAQSHFIEVQERASTYLHFMKWLGKQLEENQNSFQGLIEAFAELFSTDLNPVHPKAQKKATEKLPPGLNLDDWIGPKWPEIENDSDADEDSVGVPDKDDIDGWLKEPKKELTEKEKHERQERLQAREDAQRDSEYYLKGSTNLPEPENKLTSEEINKIPIKPLDEKIERIKVSSSRKRGKQKSFTVNTRLEKVKGQEDDNTDEEKPTDPFDALSANIDLVTPLDKDEVIKKMKPYSQAKGTSSLNKSSIGENQNPDNKIKDKKKDKKDKKDKKKDKNKNENKKKDKKKKNENKNGKESESKPKKAKKEKPSKEKPEKEEESQKPIPEENNLLDLLNFGDEKLPNSSPAANNQSDNKNHNTENKSKKSKKEKTKKEEEEEEEKKIESNTNNIIDPFDTFGLFDMTQKNGTVEEKNTKDKKSSKKASKDKTNSSNLNGTIEENLLKNLFSNDDINIKYSLSSCKKNSSIISLKITTENISKKTIKNVKIQLSGHKEIKLIKKTTTSEPSSSSSSAPSSSVTLAKNLDTNTLSSCKINLKCKNYFGKDTLKCKITYSIDDTKSYKYSSELSIPTYYFIVPSEKSLSVDEVSDIVKDEIKFPNTLNEKIKIPKEKPLNDILDYFSQIWKLQIIESSDDRMTYYSPLLLDRHLAVLLKINSAKHSLSLTLKSSSEQFSEAFVEEFNELISS